MICRNNHPWIWLPAFLLCQAGLLAGPGHADEVQAGGPSIRLNAPEDGGKASAGIGLFSWEPAESLAGQKGITYTVTMVTVEEDQGPFEALAFNAPLLDQRGITETHLDTDGSIPWQDDAVYAWQVTAFQGKEAVGHSPVWTLGSRSFDGRITREEVGRIVLHQIITPPLLDHRVTAYLMKEPMQPGDRVHSYMQDDYITLGSPAWFVWINDDPQAFFAHSCRYVWVDRMTGKITIEEKEWWPVLNGRSLFMSDEEWTDRNLILYSDVHFLP